MARVLSQTERNLRDHEVVSVLLVDVGNHRRQYKNKTAQKPV